MAHAAFDVLFSNISYTVPAKRESVFSRRRTPEIPILHNVSGYIGASESLGILGPSGSGKTTLLNVLAARGEIGAPLSGKILFSGSPRSPRTKRSIGYVTQDDVFLTKLTVRETLNFTASIRLPRSMTANERDQCVDNVIRRLRLKKCENTQVGDSMFNRGLSGGERKRLNVANELLHHPGLLLADEVTSGLDSSSAIVVMKFLCSLCQNKSTTLITTIHQPSSRIFSMFSKILLMSEGRVAYFGSPAAVVSYFESIDLPFPIERTNPADQILHLVTPEIKDDISSTVTEGDNINTVKHVLNSWANREKEEVSLVGIDEANYTQGIREGECHIVLSVSDATDYNGHEEINYETTAMETDSKAPEIVPSENENGAPHQATTYDVNPQAHPYLSPTTIHGRMFHAISKRLNGLKLVSLQGLPMTIERGSGERGEEDKYEVGLLQQVSALSRRAMRQKSGVLIEWPNLLNLIVVTVVISIFWFRIEEKEETIEDRLGALSFIAVYWAFTSTSSAIFNFPAEKHVLTKDRASGAYRLSAYCLAKTLIEIPADMFYPVIHSSIIYYMMGMNPELRAFLLFMIIVSMNVLVGQGLGMLLSAIAMNIRYSQVLVMAVVLVSLANSGYLIDPNNIPSFIKPLGYFSFIRVAYESMVRNEVSYGRTFVCAPEGQSTVYSGNRGVCPVNKESLLKGASIGSSMSIVGNIGVQMAWIVLARVLTYFALKWIHTSHKPRRSAWK